MYKRLLIPLLYLGLSASSHALTDAGKAAGEELIAALKEEAKNLKERGKDAGESEEHGQYGLNQLISQFQAALASNNIRQIEKMFDWVRSGNLSTDKTRKCLAKLMEELKTEREQKTGAQVKELEDLVKRAQDKILQAKSPEELDGILGELAKDQSREYRESGYENDQPNPRLSELRQQIPQIKQYVTEWQNYLHAMYVGDTADAMQALKTISSSGTEMGIPRSQILAREDQINSKAGTATDIIAGIKNLDGMRDAIKALIAHQQKNRYSGNAMPDIADLTNTLKSMEKTYREYLAGLPVNIEIYGWTYDSSDRVGNASLIPLRSELIALVLPRYVGAPEDTHAKPGETVQQILVRMAAEAKTKGDMLLCERIQQTQQIFNKGTANMFTESIGLREYNAAQNQIGAGQYMLAVLYLQKALKGGSDLLPLQKIGQQLESIRKDHPKEYEAGMKEFLAPSPPTQAGVNLMNMDPRARARFMNGMENRGMSAGSPTLSLPVPGKDDAAPANTEGTARKPRGRVVPPAVPPVPSHKENGE